MPADPTPKSTQAPRKRTVQSKRGAIACSRCKTRKAKCVPAPPGASNVPTCTNCLSAGAECVYLDRTPNELFLLEYVSQLETRVATLELELAKYQPNSEFTVDHSKTQAAAIESLTQQYPPGTWPVNGAAVDVLGAANIPGPGLELPPGSQAQETKPDIQDEENDDLAYGLGMLSLSGSGEPVYVGASSGVNWARVCATPGSTAGLTSNLSRFNYLAPPEQSTIESALSYSMHHPIPPLPSAPLAAQYIEAAYQHIQARYGFLDWPTVRNWHENREAICLNRPLWGVGRGKDYRRNMAAFTLWLLYGYGARLTEDEKLEGAVSHEVYHNIAVACLSNVASHHSLATVQAELLLTIYSFRHPQPEISVWQTAGLALRTAVQIGLHRKARSKAEREKDPMGYEIRKRAFWTVYTLDRMLALQLGRPSGIQDRDIDIELPLNIDVEYNEPHEIFEMQNRQMEASSARRPGDEYANGYDSITSMTSAIHNVRLNQMKQLIQDAIYRLDQPLRTRVRSPSATTQAPSPFDTETALPEVDDLLSRLSQWKACNPILPPGRSGVPLLSKSAQDMEYHNCVQMLLRPVISAHFSSPRYVGMCFDSAASQCEIQWLSLDQAKNRQYRLSNWALYRLFLSGLTLLHLASSPTTVPVIDIDRAGRALSKCRECLSVFIRHLPAMKAYEDTFKDLVTAWESKGKVSADQVHEARMFASGPQAQQEQGQVQVQGRPRTATSSSITGMGSGAADSPSQWFNMSMASTPQPIQQQQQQGQPPQSFGMSALGVQNFGYSSTTGLQSGNGMTSPMQGVSSQSFDAFSNRMAGGSGGGGFGNIGNGMGNFGMAGAASQANNGNGNTVNVNMNGSAAGSWGPMIDQLAGRPGGGVRDDFSSLLSSLGVNMDETIGESFPPMSEDHLWTADWGLLAPIAESDKQDTQGQIQGPSQGQSLIGGSTSANDTSASQTLIQSAPPQPHAHGHGHGHGHGQGQGSSQMHTHSHPQGSNSLPVSHDSFHSIPGSQSINFEWFSGPPTSRSGGGRTEEGGNGSVSGHTPDGPMMGMQQDDLSSSLTGSDSIMATTGTAATGGGLGAVGMSDSQPRQQLHLPQQQQQQQQPQPQQLNSHTMGYAFGTDDELVHALDGSMTEDIWKFPFG